MRSNRDKKQDQLIRELEETNRMLYRQDRSAREHFRKKIRHLTDVVEEKMPKKDLFQT